MCACRTALALYSPALTCLDLCRSVSTSAAFCSFRFPLAMNVIQPFEQILMGLVPIPQVSEPYSAVAFLAQRVDLVKYYGLKQPPRPAFIPLPSAAAASNSSAQEVSQQQQEWSAFSICEAVALDRKMFTRQAGRPDAYRAGVCFRFPLLRIASFLMRVYADSKSNSARRGSGSGGAVFSAASCCFICLISVSQIIVTLFVYSMQSFVRQFCYCVRNFSIAKRWMRKNQSRSNSTFSPNFPWIYLQNHSLS